MVISKKLCPGVCKVTSTRKKTRLSLVARGRKTKPSYAKRIAELTAQFIKEEKQRVLALKEVRALKPKEKAPKRKPDNLKFSSVQKAC